MNPQFIAQALANGPYPTNVGNGTPNGTGVTAKEFGCGTLHKTVLTLAAYSLTLTLNGTSSAGGGAKIYDFPEGLILPIGAVADLVVTNAGGDGSFLASLGSAAADTGGTLTSTEISFAPQTAATVTAGTGTSKMKSTVLAPVPGVPFDGTSTPIDLFLNAALNADGTGKATLVFTGTITFWWLNLGDVT